MFNTLTEEEKMELIGGKITFKNGVRINSPIGSFYTGLGGLGSVLPAYAYAAPQAPSSGGSTRCTYR